MISFKHIFLLVFIFFLSAVSCQVPGNEHNTEISAQSFQNSLSEADLTLARKRLRPNSRDSLTPIYDTSGKMVSWLITYDPPLQNKPEPDFTAQRIYAFEDIFPHTYYVIGAEFYQPPNIDLNTFAAWYARNQYGGWRNHPDIWVRDKACYGQYTISVGGSIAAKAGEQRYPGYSPGARYSYRDSIVGYRAEWDGIITVKIPSSMQRTSPIVQIDKTPACDGSSPGFNICRRGNGLCSDPVPSPTPTPTEEERDYCMPSVYKRSLDPHESTLAQLEVDIETLELEVDLQDFEEDSFEEDSFEEPPSFKAQSLNPTPFHVATGDPSGGENFGDDYPDKNSYSGEALVEQDQVEYQLQEIETKINILKSRIEKLRENYTNLSTPEYAKARHVLLDTLLENLDAIERPLQENFKPYLDFLCDELAPDEFAQRDIDLLSFRFNSNQDIILKGRANYSSNHGESLTTLTPDFWGNIELLEEPQIQYGDYGFFEIKIPYENYQFTEQHLEAYDFEDSYILDLNQIPELKAQLNAQFTTQDTNSQDTQIDGVSPAYNYCANANCRVMFVLPAARVISPEEMLEYMKISVEDAAFNTFDPQKVPYAAMIITGVGNTYLDLVVPTSVIDVVPGGKFGGKVVKFGGKYFIKIGDKVFKARAVKPIVYEGKQLFLKLKGVSQADAKKLPDSIFTKVRKNPSRYTIANLDELLDVRKYLDEQLSLMPDLDALISRVTGGKEHLVKMKKALEAADEAIATYTKDRHESIRKKLSNAVGVYEELRVTYALLKRQANGAKIKLTQIDGDIVFGNGLSHQQVDIIADFNTKKTFVEVKAQCKKTDLFDEISPEKPDGGQGYRLIQAAKEHGAELKFMAESASADFITKASIMSAKYKVKISVEIID